MHTENQMEMFPAVRVVNEVSWVNPHMDLPFSLHAGSPTNIGVFLTNPNVIRKADIHLGVKESHVRSAQLAKVIVRDNYGNLYKDFDLKGTGMVDVAMGLGKLKVFPVH